MDTNFRSIKSGGRGRRYQKHSLELKRRIVEQTLLPGASVARIAREHGINANQVFGWRKLYREGLLGAGGKESGELLPVAVISAGQGTARAPMPTAARGTVGRLWLESPKGCLSIDGQPDPATLRLILEHLLG